MTTITSEAFTYDKRDKSFTGEMSTVQSAIQGNVLSIKSQWTGKVEKFILEKVDKSRDIAIFYYYAQNPKLKGYRAIIFND